MENKIVVVEGIDLVPEVPRVFANFVNAGGTLIVVGLMKVKKTVLLPIVIVGCRYGCQVSLLV